MILVNGLTDQKVKSKKALEMLTIILAPFTPYLAEELWQKLGNVSSVFEAAWPEYDEKLIADTLVTIAIQINGKVRDQIIVSTNTKQDEVIKLAKGSLKVQKYLGDKEPAKVIYVPNKLLSLVVK
jgi:leucyl-tRNA synthetase